MLSTTLHRKTPNSHSDLELSSRLVDLLGFQGTEFIQLLVQRRRPLLSLSLAKAELFSDDNREGGGGGGYLVQSEEEKRLRKQLRKEEKKRRKGRTECDDNEEEFAFDAQQMRLER